MARVSSTNNTLGKVFSAHASCPSETSNRLDIANNPTQICDIFPVAPSASRHGSQSFSPVSENATAAKTNNLKLIETVDVSAQVTESLKNADIKKQSASYDQLFTFCKKAIDSEVKIVGLQLAIMSKLLDSESPHTTAKEMSLVSADGTVGNHAARFALYLKEHKFERVAVNATDDAHPQIVGVFINDSNIRWGKDKTICPMSNRRHMLMRGLEVVTTCVHGRLVRGKPYADFLEPSKPKGKTVFTYKGTETISVDKYNQLFRQSENFIPRVHDAILRDQHESLKVLNKSHSDLHHDSFSDLDFSKVKPNLVLTATAAESRDFVGKCSFPRGEWHIELPQKVREQMRFSDRHDLAKPELQQKFIFVQEMGTGNILLAVHLDTTFHHSTPLAGAPVVTAGELIGNIYKAEDGKHYLQVRKFVNDSGHYEPPFHSMVALRSALINSGMSPVSEENKIKFSGHTVHETDRKLMMMWNDETMGLDKDVLVNREREMQKRSINNAYEAAVKDHLDSMNSEYSLGSSGGQSLSKNSQSCTF